MGTPQGSYAISNREDNLDTRNLLISQLQQGHLNCLVTGTLNANATSTTITAPTCTANSGIFACPVTAHAANDIPLMSYAPASGQFVITHASNARVDRSFVFVILG